MNEKIKSFFVCAGGFCSALFFVILSVFTRRNGNSVKNGMANAERELSEAQGELGNFEQTQSERKSVESERRRTQSERNSVESERNRIERENAELLGKCESVFAAVEKRNADK